MKNRFRLPTLLVRARALSVLWVSLAGLALQGGAAIPPPERLLPDDTLLVLTVPDFAKLREITKTSAQTQCWYDPALKPFKDKFVGKLRSELVEPLERDLGASVDDYTSLLQGQVTLAASPAGVLLLLDSRDKSGQLKSNLAGLRRKWVDSGKAVRTEKIREIEFSILSVSEKDLPPSLKKLASSSDEDSESETNRAKNELVFGQYESLLVVGSSMKAVEKVAASLTGGSVPVLADLPAFQANYASMFRDAPAYGWVNIKTILDLVLRKQKEKETENPNPFAFFDPQKLLNALGISGLKTIAFNIQDSREGSSLQLFVGVPESTRSGLFKLFPAAKESGPPPFVPADAVKFQRMRIDGRQAWATLEKIANDMQPGSLNQLVDVINTEAKEKDPNFDLRRDLFDNLGDDIISYQKAPTGATLTDLASPPSLLLLGSQHADQLTAALKMILTLSNSQGGAPTEREFLGRKIYSSPPPPFLAMIGAGAAAKGPHPQVNFSASGGYVAIGTDVPLLEEFLRSSDGTQKKLRETSGLAEAISRAGGSSTGWLGYENQVETTRAAFEALRKSASSEDRMLAPGIPAFMPESAFKEWLDFSLLPPFEKIAKYFYFTVYTCAANSEGLVFKMYAPVPPQLKK